MITVSMDGAAAFKAKLEATLDRTRNLEPALLRSGMVVLKAAADRIDSGGPGWAPNITGTPLLHQTGRLLSSLSIGAAGNVDDITQNTISVGTNVAYAAWLQIGTGIFGPKGERITPKSANALAFPIGGKTMFFSSIAGAPPRRFLYIDQAVADQVRTVFARYILEGQAGS